MPARILLIEDNPIIRLDVQGALEGMGHQVVEAVDNGMAAIASARQLHPDLIVMDITIKGDMDGITAAEKIGTDIPLLFLTGHDDEETLQRAKLVKPFAYLLKPFDSGELHRSIELALQRAREELPSQEHHETKAEGIPDTGSILKDHRLFRTLPPELLAKLESETLIQECAGGEFLIQAGATARSAYIPVTGRLALTQTSRQGKELTIALLGPGDAFGLLYALPIFSDQISLRAQTPCRVMALPRKTVIELRDKEPNFASALLQEASEQLLHSHALAASLAHSRVESRIVATLLNLIPQFGRQSSKERETRLYLTRKELAELTGTTPETAIRVTKALERDGYLDLTRPGIIKILDYTKFESLLAE